MNRPNNVDSFRPERKHGSDLTGLVFGRLTVLEFAGYADDTKKTIRTWACRCECGRTTITTTQRLDEGKTKSCGCLRRETNKDKVLDLTGKRFGRLVVEGFVSSFIENEGRKHPRLRRNRVWCCACDCGSGKKTYSTTKRLQSGDMNSCGCLKDGIFGAAAKKKLLIEYKRNAKHRGLNWELTSEQFFELTQRPCVYCGVLPSTVKRVGRRNGAFTYNGVDRVDNSIGYTIANAAPCCKLCNHAKRDMPYGEFMSWVDRLAKHRFKFLVGQVKMPINCVLVDYDCSLEHALLLDIAEMCTVISQRDFSRPSPSGWGTSAVVRVATSTTDIAPKEWVIGFFSHPTAVDALGFHDVTDAGQPMLHIFPKLETDPADIPVTVMHELIEALVDPTCLISSVGPDGIVRALETGDPVESDWFEYTASSGRKLRCTNWVLPAWFGGIAGPLDHLGLCTHPGEIRPGGYQIIYDATKGWTQQVAGEKRAYRREVGAAGRTRLASRVSRYVREVSSQAINSQDSNTK